MEREHGRPHMYSVCSNTGALVKENDIENENDKQFTDVMLQDSWVVQGSSPELQYPVTWMTSHCLRSRQCAKSRLNLFELSK